MRSRSFRRGASDVSNVGGLYRESEASSKTSVHAVIERRYVQRGEVAGDLLDHEGVTRTLKLFSSNREGYLVIRLAQWMHENHLLEGSSSAT